MEWTSALLLNLVLGTAALVSSLSGFGYALVAIPFMVLLFPPQQAIPVVTLSWMPLAALLVWESHPLMSVRRIGLLLGGACAGVPVGAYGLARIEPGTMRTAIGAITLLAAVALVLKPARPFRRERLVGPLAGLLSGVLGGASGMSGPPVVLFGLNQGWEHRGFRADLIGYFVALHILSLVLFRGFGILGARVLEMSGWALPAILVGYVAGIRFKERVSQAQFRVLAFGLVGLGGVLALVV